MDVKIKVFYSCSPEDRKLRDELVTHLGRVYVDHLDDRQILPGEARSKKIELYLNTADVILLLISPKYIASDDCYHVQMGRALERQAAGEVQVIPIILSPTDYPNEPFSKLEVLPTGGKPVTRWLDRQEALHNVAVGVRKVIASTFIKQCITDAKTYSDQGFYEEALATCEKAIKHIHSTTSLDYNTTLYASIYEVYGDILQQQKQMEEALSAYSTAISFISENARLYTNRGEVLFIIENFESALDDYTKAISLNRNEPLLYSRRGDVLQRLKRFDEALATYNTALRLFPKRADFYKNRGDVLQKLKRFDDALASYDEAIHIDPKNATFYLDKGSIFFRRRAYDQALAVYDEAIRRAPPNAEIWRIKGKIHSHIAQMEEALAAYEKAIELEPKNQFFYKEEGDIFLKLERLAEALAAFEDAIRLDPDFGPAHCSMGTVLEKLADCTYQRIKQRADHAYNRAKQLGINC